MTKTKAPKVPTAQTEKQPGNFWPSAYLTPVTNHGDKLHPFRLKDATEAQILAAVAPWVERGFSVRIHRDPQRLLLVRIVEPTP
jgi:hypothetical protein